MEYVSKSFDYDNETKLNSAVILGAALGALTAGVFADALGPKRAQAFNVFNFLLGAALSATANCHLAFLAGRIISGIGKDEVDWESLSRSMLCKEQARTKD